MPIWRRAWWLSLLPVALRVDRPLQAEKIQPYAAQDKSEWGEYEIKACTDSNSTGDAAQKPTNPLDGF